MMELRMMDIPVQAMVGKPVMMDGRKVGQIIGVKDGVATVAIEDREAKTLLYGGMFSVSIRRNLE